MKINLGTTSDVSNVKTTPKVDGKSDKSEDDSFFGKLAALFSGGDSKESQVKTAVGKGDSSTQGKLEAKTDAEAAKLGDDEAVGEKLKSLTADGDIDTAKQSKVSGESSAELTPDSQALKTSDPGEKTDKLAQSAMPQLEESESEGDVSSVMDEGKTVLNRLKEANGTLVSGKALPQDSRLDTESVKNTEIDGQETIDVTQLKGVKEVKIPSKTSHNQQVTPSQDNNGVNRGPQFDFVTDSQHVSLEQPVDIDTLPIPNDIKKMLAELPPEEAQEVVSQYLVSQDKEISPEMTDGIQGSLPSNAVQPLEQNAAESMPEEPIRTRDSLLSAQHKMSEGDNIPTQEQLAYFSPNLNMAASGQQQQSEALVVMGDDGQFINLDSLSKAEIEKLAHKQGKTIDQLLASAVQMNTVQHQSQFAAIQQADKQALNSVAIPTANDASAPLNSVAATDVAAQMAKNMNRSLDPRFGLDSDNRKLDIRELEGDKISKDGHMSQSFSAIHNQATQSLTQLSKLDAAQAQPPVHINKEMASDQLAERVQMMLSKNLKNIDIRLDPPELGKVHIRMHMNGDATSVQFTVANHHARDALENSLPRLREMLSQQGVQVGDTAVQQQSSQQQNGYAASGREQSQGGNSGVDSGFGAENTESDVTLTMNVKNPRDGISYYA
ncbi:flagellar hook-length control protein FliK [Vibrio viridaestus]|uniref:Flagellar hook-length control protein FliK n=1 Tax=Vibrio viridaestus TaxID=2487322 RepID=A0A3N9TII3_9VIBR|nr:flagellar hook-length control protein FliK [Vibrio viridaestus]RQW64107.1 flagellar hook-length control protein FliK [Vibrio viridaestus]